jgi:hypothetical protein
VATGLILFLRANQHCRRFPHKEGLDWAIIDQQCCSLSGSKNRTDNLQVESHVYEALAGRRKLADAGLKGMPACNRKDGPKLQESEGEVVGKVKEKVRHGVWHRRLLRKSCWQDSLRGSRTGCATFGRHTVGV